MTVTRGEWDAIQNTITYITRFMEDRRDTAVHSPPGFRLAMEGLHAELERWRSGRPGELSIICKAHRRRCELQEAGEYGGARIRHANSVRTSRGDLCFSQLLDVRWSYEYGRVTVLDELVPAFVRQ